MVKSFAVVVVVIALLTAGAILIVYRVTEPVGLSERPAERAEAPAASPPSPYQANEPASGPPAASVLAGTDPNAAPLNQNPVQAPGPMNLAPPPPPAAAAAPAVPEEDEERRDSNRRPNRGFRRDRVSRDRQLEE